MKRVVFLGFNSFKEHKRGVENVIEFQASILDTYAYYLHWGNNFKVYKYNKFVCISLTPHSISSYILLNIIIKKIFTKQKKNVAIHSHNALMSILLLRKTDLLTVHDGLFYQKKAISCRSDKLIIFYILEKFLYMRCNWVHFISNFTKSKSLYPLGKHNYTIIYNSSNIEEKVLSYVANVELFNKTYPFLKGKKYCFLVRSLEERARIDLIIEVAKINPDLIFVVAGKGPLYDSLNTKITKDNVSNCILLGYINENNLFMLYYFASFVIVSADYGEGFGLPIIEGYLFNKPVIASSRCAIPEIIIDQSYLFENNIQSISNAISHIDIIKRNDFKRYYMNRFSKNIIEKRYLELYSQCIPSL